MVEAGIKVVLSAILLVAVSEIAKRSTLMGAVLASLPLTSILALCFLYFDTRDATKTAELSSSIFWVLIPSLVFFVSFPALIKTGLHFVPSLLVSIAIMSGSYFGFVVLLRKFGVEI